MRQVAVIMASLAVFLGSSAGAQESWSEIGLQGTGFFTTDTTGQGTTQRRTNTGGFLVGYRYSFNHRLGALVFDPTGNSFGTVAGAQHQATAVFAYGGGAAFPLFQARRPPGGVSWPCVQRSGLWAVNAQQQNNHSHGGAIRWNRIPLLIVAGADTLVAIALL